MERVNIFKNNTSQAVRLPKAVAYPDSVQQVDIVIQRLPSAQVPAGYENRDLDDQESTGWSPGGLQDARRADVHFVGHAPIEPYDEMIAGHARSLGLIVVTNNLKQFRAVSGIRVENWVK